jgi:hypothetical protein
MPKTVEYRVIPVTHWIITRFEAPADGAIGHVGSTRRGEFQNEDEAYETASLLAKAEDGARLVSRGSLNRSVSGSIGSGGLSAA